MPERIQQDLIAHLETAGWHQAQPTGWHHPPGCWASQPAVCRTALLPAACAVGCMHAGLGSINAAKADCLSQSPCLQAMYDSWPACSLHTTLCRQVCAWTYAGSMSRLHQSICITSAKRLLFDVRTCNMQPVASEQGLKSKLRCMQHC